MAVLFGPRHQQEVECGRLAGSCGGMSREPPRDPSSDIDRVALFFPGGCRPCGWWWGEWEGTGLLLSPSGWLTFPSRPICFSLQQHESLEKQNRALRKEIQDLQAELAWLSRTLHRHVCLIRGASCLAPLPPDCWDQAQHPLDPAAHGQHGCQEQLGLFQTPVSSPSAQHLSPDLQPHGSSGFLLSPLASLSFGPTTVTAPPAQLSPGPVRSASPSGSSLLRPSSKFSSILPSPSTQTVPPQPLGLECPTSEKQESSLHIPSAALGLACLQGREHEPSSLAAEQQGLFLGLSSHLLLASSPLSSAQVYF